MWNLRLRRARWREWRLAQLRFFRPGFLLIATLAAGCARPPKLGDRAGGFEAITAPLPPPFLNGPMAALLTNAEGFRAKVVLASGTAPHSAPLAAGELMGRGSKLLFAPVVSKAARKKAPAEDSAFIWDVVENRGWMLNDPMQGYAPITSRQSYTNLISGAILRNAAPERIAGHRCQETEVTVTASDGTASAFRVWRAEDLNGLPLRITGIANGAPITLAARALPARVRAPGGPPHLPGRNGAGFLAAIPPGALPAAPRNGGAVLRHGGRNVASRRSRLRGCDMLP